MFSPGGSSRSIPNPVVVAPLIVIWIFITPGSALEKIIEGAGDIAKETVCKSDDPIELEPDAPEEMPACVKGSIFN